jgi:probable F420-dependent oxidoreductase
VGGLATAGEIGRVAVEAEKLGFDSLWMGDHIAFPAPILDAFQVLACCASHTTRIQLGTCVYLLPLRHPTVVAKGVATLDYLSDGRVIFGVGVGGEFPREFEASGVPVKERGARTDEALPLLRRLWGGEPVAHAGRHYRFEAVLLKPAPIQPGGPRIWIGGRSEAALRRAARFGDGYVGYLLSPEGFEERMQRIHELAIEAGRKDVQIARATMTFALVDMDREAALQRVGMILGAMYGRDMRSAAARYCIAGRLDDCRAAVERFRAAGVEHLILTPLGDPHEQMPALISATR